MKRILYTLSVLWIFFLLILLHPVYREEIIFDIRNRNIVSIEWMFFRKHDEKRWEIIEYAWEDQITLNHGQVLMIPIKNYRNQLDDILIENIPQNADLSMRYRFYRKENDLFYSHSQYYWAWWIETKDEKESCVRIVSSLLSKDNRCWLFTVNPSVIEDNLKVYIYNNGDTITLNIGKEKSIIY